MERGFDQLDRVSSGSSSSTSLDLPSNVRRQHQELFSPTPIRSWSVPPLAPALGMLSKFPLEPRPTTLSPLPSDDLRDSSALTRILCGPVKLGATKRFGLVRGNASEVNELSTRRFYAVRSQLPGGRYGSEVQYHGSVLFPAISTKESTARKRF